jgi:hypothetical protein
MESGEIVEVLEEMHAASDRALAIVGAALVDDQLSRALIEFLHPHKSITEELFAHSGALGSFGTRAKLGLLIGLYGEMVYSDFKFVIKIRNEFAHSMSGNSFDRAPISDWCKNLRLAERYVADGTSDRKRPVPGSRPKDFSYWFRIEGLFASLASSRSRFELTIQCLLYALSASPTGSAMPEPRV